MCLRFFQTMFAIIVWKMYLLFVPITIKAVKPDIFEDLWNANSNQGSHYTLQIYKIVQNEFFEWILGITMLSYELYLPKMHSFLSEGKF